MFIDLATVSTGGKRESVRKNDDGSVSVSFYVRPPIKDRELMNVSARFFGKTAELAAQFTPGQTILLSGDLVQNTSVGADGKTYVNNDIYNASFRYLPNTNGGNGGDASASSFDPKNYDEEDDEPQPTRGSFRRPPR